MYLNLAVRNVKRQVGNYLIYFMTVSLTVALLFAINNVIYSRELAVFVDRGESARTALKILVAAISFVVAFVLSYATSFLLKSTLGNSQPLKTLHFQSTPFFLHLHFSVDF
nr:hypothetical protein [uncultured Acetatifactor sp.]